VLRKDSKIEQFLLKEAQLRRERQKHCFVTKMLFNEVKEKISSSESTQKIKKDMPVSVPLEREIDYLSKSKNKGRRLLRNRTSSAEEKLIKGANILDISGETKIADKIDILLSRIKS